jgi:hypothetical protein
MRECCDHPGVGQCAATCSSPLARAGPVRFGDPGRLEALGWRGGHRYLPGHVDIASTALFYLDAPSSTPPVTPTRDELETL